MGGEREGSGGVCSEQLEKGDTESSHEQSEAGVKGGRGGFGRERGARRARGGNGREKDGGACRGACLGRRRLVGVRGGRSGSGPRGVGVWAGRQ